MSKKDYQGLGLVLYRAEQISKAKQRLKHEADNLRPVYQRKRRLISKRICKIRYEENYQWENFNNLVDNYKKRGLWRQDIEHTS
ncbi:MAG: hypothetical protein IJ415_03420 [Clostridia bacterium]|nr:hypothetical protein [Clostridia bacterium]